MKRILAFLVLISCVAVGPAIARDILVVPIPSGGAHYGSTDTPAAVLSDLLSDIASDIALKAARDHGPEAVRAFQKHGPILLKTMRNWTESALNSGGRYAIQTCSKSYKFVPKLLTGGKDVGLNALAASKGFALEGFHRFLKGSESSGTRTLAKVQTHKKSGHQKSSKKTLGQARLPHGEI
jgi:hypothetical protein